MYNLQECPFIVFESLGAPSTLPALSLSVCILSWPLSTPGTCSCRCLCWSAVAIRSICWTLTLRLCWGSTSRPSSSGFCRSRLKAVARHPGTSSCDGRPDCSSSQPGERERENVSRLTFEFSFGMMSFDTKPCSKDHHNFCIIMKLVVHPWCDVIKMVWLLFVFFGNNLDMTLCSYPILTQKLECSRWHYLQLTVTFFGGITTQMFRLQRWIITQSDITCK